MQNLTRKATALVLLVAWLFTSLPSLAQVTAFRAAGQKKIQSIPATYVVPEEVIFATKDGTSPSMIAREHGLVLDANRETYLLAKTLHSRVSYIAKIGDYQNLDEVIQRLQEDSRVVYAERHLLVPVSPIKMRRENKVVLADVSSTPSPQDLRTELQWFLDKIQSPEGFSAQTTVAVIGTGVTPASNQLRSALVAGGYDFVNHSSDYSDFDGHDTFVAGEISGQYGMGSVPILPLRVVKGTDATGHTLIDLLAASDAIRYAVDHGARVLNMSFGGKGITPQYFIEALRYAADHGALAVFSAGNLTQSNDLIEFSPANTSREEWNAISVAATNKADELASFSNWGFASVQTAAPGEEIFGEQSTATSYTFGSGTSGAAPIVSALLAKAFDLYIISGSDLIAQAKAAKEAVLSTGDALTSLIGKVGSASRVNVTRLIGGSRNPLPELVLPSSFQVTKKQKVTLSGDFSNPQGIYASFVWQIDDNEATTTVAPALLYKAKGVGSHTLSCTVKLYSGSSFVVTSTIQVIKKIT